MAGELPSGDVRMTVSRPWERIVKALVTRRDDIVGSVGYGNAPTWDAYQRQAGEVRGITEAIELIEAEFKKEDSR